MHSVTDLPTPGRRPLLERLVFRGIVFNMSWEDPEMDRRAFNIQPDDVAVSITSAGCNPLNILCQNPKRLICVDGNPAQNAVMELKMATIATQDHETFFDIFAARDPRRIEFLYRRDLRERLSVRSQKFWDRNLKIAAKGLYRFGRMGLFCRLLRAFLRVNRIGRKRIDGFFECRSLEAQTAYYNEHIAPRLWRRPVRMLISFKPFLYLAGVHPKQFKLVHNRHNMYRYIRERIDYALTQVPIYDNYFLSQAVSGRFRGNRVPPYLLEENFDILRDSLHKIEVVNGWLGPYLDTQPAGSITKFNLLDIFDWMPEALFEQTLRSALRAAKPGSTMIYRSGSYKLDPPDSLKPYFDHDEDLSRELLATDRSMTYGSFYVLHVKDGYPANGNGTNGSGAGNGKIKTVAAAAG